MTKLIGNAASNSAIDMLNWDLSALLSGSVTSSSAHVVVISTGGFHGGSVYTLKGNFTAFDGDGRPTAGTLSSLTSATTGGLSTTTNYTLSAFSMNVATFFAYITNNDMTGLEASLFPVKDTFADTHNSDTLIGLGGKDTFDLTAQYGEFNGGTDTIFGGGGDDQVLFGGNLTADDSIDGGSGNDTVSLDGNYQLSLAFNATTMVNVETLTFAGGHSYVIATADANVGAFQGLKVKADTLGTFDTLSFDGGAEHDGFFNATGGAGADMLRGGAQGDQLNGGDGNDTLFGDSAPVSPAKLVSTSASGYQDNTGISFAGVFSPGDHRIVFISSADDLVAGDTNGTFDVFVKDLDSGAITLVSTDALGNQQDSTDISSGVVLWGPDGDHVLFTSRATNLTPNQIDDGGDLDVFIKTLSTGAISLVSSTAAGVDKGFAGAGDGDVRVSDISADGTIALLQGYETGLDGNFDIHAQIYAKNLVTGAVTVLSTTGLGANGNQDSYNAHFSPDGTKIVFDSDAYNMVDDHNGARDVFVKDLASGVVTRASTTAGGAEANGASFFGTFSPDGTKLLFSSTASNLVAGDTNGAMDVFIKDLATGAVTLVSSNSAGQIGTGGPSGQFGVPFFSSDGTLVAFGSYADNLVDGDTGGQLDVFVKNLLTGQIARVSVDSSGIGGNQGSYPVSFSADGKYLVFDSDASNLVSSDLNNPFNLSSVGRDVFLVNVPLFASGSDLLTGGGGDDTLYGMGSVDNLLGGDGNDTIYGGDGNDRINGGNGVNYMEGNAGNDRFALSGTDTGLGGNGADQFAMGDSLDAADAIDGGAGTDLMTLTGNYATLDILSAQSLTAIERLNLLGNFSYKLQLDDGNVAAGTMLTVDTLGVGVAGDVFLDGSAESDGRFTFLVGTANNWLSGGAGNDVFVRSATGPYSLLGQGGDDAFQLYGALTASAAVDGGAGSDTVNLDGDYSAGVVFASTTMVNVERLNLAPGHNYTLTTHDGTVSPGGTLTVVALLQAANSLTFDGSAEVDGAFIIAAGAGDDFLTGGADNDVFGLTLGGNDHANGGGGQDFFQLGAALTLDDRIDGGTGSDTVSLNADYAALVFAATTMVNVETLALAAGHDYTLTLADGNVAAGATLAVDGHALGIGDTLIFDGSDESDGSYVVTAGKADDRLTGGNGSDTLSGGDGNDSLSSESASSTLLGGKGDDVILLGVSAFAAGLHIDGGAGNDTLKLSAPNGGTALNAVFGATTMTGIETLWLLPIGTSFNVTLADGSVAAGQTLKVQTINFIPSETVMVDGSTEGDGSFILDGGAGVDTFTSGAGNDSLTGADGNDSLTGNEGKDTLNGGNGDDVLLGGGGNDSLTSGTGNDTLDGGAGKDLIDAGYAGDKTIQAGDGNDIILFGAFLNQADSVDGGTGTDTLILDGFYSGAGTILLTAIETVKLVDGHSYSLSIGRSDGGVLTVDGSTVNNSLQLDGEGSTRLLGGLGNDTLSALSGTSLLVGGDGNDDLYGGSGTSTMQGGNGNDFFRSFGGHDKMDGEDGSDTYDFLGILGSVFSTNVQIHDTGTGPLDKDTLKIDEGCTVALQASTLQGIEKIDLGTGDYDLSFVDANFDNFGDQDIEIHGENSSSLRIDDTAETGDLFIVYVYGGAGNDVLQGAHSSLHGGAGDDLLVAGFKGSALYGDAGHDILIAGAAEDYLEGGAGADVFVFDSLVDAHDRIGDFTASEDHIDLPFAVTAATLILAGTLNSSNFEGDINDAFADLGQHEAAIFRPDAGDMAGQYFLGINTDGNIGFNLHTDLFIQMWGGTVDATGFSTANFI